MLRVVKSDTEVKWHFPLVSRIGIVDLFQFIDDVPGTEAIYNTRSKAFPLVSRLAKKKTKEGPPGLTQ